MPSHLYQTLILPSAVRRRRSSRLPFSSCSCSLSQHQYMSDHDGTGLWLWQVDWQWQLLLQGQTRRDIDPEYLNRLRRRRPRSSNSLIVSFARGCSPWATTCICQLQHRAVVNAAIDSLRASQSLRATIGTGSKFFFFCRKSSLAIREGNTNHLPVCTGCPRRRWQVYYL